MKNTATKTIKLPNRLSLALANYYISRSRSKSRKNKDDQQWDKSECLSLITQSLPKNWTWQASAGSFWFINFNLKNYKKTYYYVDEYTWPRAELQYYS